MRSLVTTLLALSLTLAACGSTPAADGPEAVVGEALTKVAAKDIDGLKGLACAGQQDLIEDQLSLVGMSGAGDLLGGFDVDALLAAVKVDVSDVKVGEATVDGDTARVPVGGSLTVTFDADAMRPILVQFLESQGATVGEEQVGALLKTLESYGQAIPINEAIRVVQEDGAWKICQDELPVPAPS